MASMICCHRRAKKPTSDSGVSAAPSPVAGKIGVRSGRGVRVGERGVTEAVGQAGSWRTGVASGSNKPAPAWPNDTSLIGSLGCSVGVAVPKRLWPAASKVACGVGVVTTGVSGGGPGVAAGGPDAGVVVAGSGHVPPGNRCGNRVGHGVAAGGGAAGVAVGALITTWSGDTANGVGARYEVSGVFKASAGSSNTVTPANGRTMPQSWPSS